MSDSPYHTRLAANSGLNESFLSRTALSDQRDATDFSNWQNNRTQDSTNLGTKLGNGDGKGWTTAQSWINGIKGVANAYLGFQQLKFGREKFEYNKGVDKLNIYNQATNINTTRNDRYFASQRGQGYSTADAKSRSAAYASTRNLRTNLDT